MTKASLLILTIGTFAAFAAPASAGGANEMLFMRVGCIGGAVGDACIGIPTPREHRQVYEGDYDRDRPVIIERHRHVHQAPVIIERHEEDED